MVTDAWGTHSSLFSAASYRTSLGLGRLGGLDR